MRKRTDLTIIDWIPFFLEYCKKNKKLSLKTVKSYKRFLKHFIEWLKISNLTHLVPSEFSLEDLENYKQYLSSLHLSKRTQNLYLIVLRQLFFYFQEKGFISLSPLKIKLFKEDKRVTSEKENLNSERKLRELERVIQNLKISNQQELRNKVILRLLISTGIRVSDLANLKGDSIRFDPKTKNFEIVIRNKKNIRKVYVWGENAKLLCKYLRVFKTSKNSPLFFGFRGKKRKYSPLTIRSIERIVKDFSVKQKLSFKLTPEKLRKFWITKLLIQQKDIEIKKEVFEHKTFFWNTYRIQKNLDIKPSVSISNNIFSWNKVEKFIEKEIDWLQQKIPTAKKRSQLWLPFDDFPFLRKIAILIVSGKIKACEINANNKKGLWNKNSKNYFLNFKQHGKEWHIELMKKIFGYFLEPFKEERIIIEPILHFGRADLGIILNSWKNLYIEIGTISSFFKLWYNLSTLKNCIFLIVPSEDYLIEFRT